MLTRYHAAITRKALVERFSPSELDAIVAANLKQDNLLFGQIGHDEYHFDNNAFDRGFAHIKSQRGLVHYALENEDVASALTAFGKLIHAAQDFYAHSNYVDLWLAQYDAHTPPTPPEIDPLIEEFINSPALHSGKLYYPLEIFSYIPILKWFVTPLLPKDSHSNMNLDSPTRGVRFAYAFEAAVKKTMVEFDQTVAELSTSQSVLFTGLSS